MGTLSYLWEWRAETRQTERWPQAYTRSLYVGGYPISKWILKDSYGWDAGCIQLRNFTGVGHLHATAWAFLKIKIKTCYMQRLLRINFTKSRSWTSPSPTHVSSSYETQKCLMFKLKGMGWSFLSWLCDSFLCIFLVSRFLKINIIAFLGNPPTLFSQRV